ncbi:MAG: hypothetical protein OEZ24_06680, partial [Candidatus Bathyarchaeota archaeon]|nr:hypothetical protein [Candidatus Bathyarchaeota archaeon]
MLIDVDGKDKSCLITSVLISLVDSQAGLSQQITFSNLQDVAYLSQFRNKAFTTVLRRIGRSKLGKALIHTPFQVFTEAAVPSSEAATLLR